MMFEDFIDNAKLHQLFTPACLVKYQYYGK